MKILIIRHGDPDYDNDTLTEKGWREAHLLAKRIAPMEVTEYFVSPLGRARDTAKPTLEAAGRTAKVCDWLQEFPPRIHRPDRPNEEKIAWDWLPQDWTTDPRFYDRNEWFKHPVMEAGGVGAAYAHVIREFDAVLAEHGYVRNGDIYEVVRANSDTLVFFCHYGLGAVLLSHLMNVSPMLLWHHTVLLATSVSTAYTEERRPGISVFRACGIGDISHLYAGGEEPAFSARFCEMYENMDERHD